MFGHIIVVTSMHIATYVTLQLRSTSNDDQWEDKRAQNSTIIVSTYYTFESVHDGNHSGEVRIFIGLSCELQGFIIYIIYITWNKFFPYQECN